MDTSIIGKGERRVDALGKVTGQAMFAALMGDHLARGGLIIAATHAPLGVQAKELRIGMGGVS